jgi:hypothetical protein
MAADGPLGPTESGPTGAGATGPPEFQLPGSTLTVTEPAKSFAVSKKDWRHLRKGVEGIRFPLQWTENVMWLAISIIPASVFAVLTWLPAYAQLPSAAQLQFSWVTPGIIATGILAFVIALYSGMVARSHRAEGAADRMHVLDDMDEMYQAGNPPNGPVQ